MQLRVHRYHLGQTVKIAQGFGYGRGSNGMFKIVTLLPSNGTHYQYKVRNSGEAFDRTVRENELILAEAQ